MPEPRAQRTLVKSPPEIWAEVSDASALARHLGEFGEIRITRLEAETTVVWEGDRARGTVELEASGWGTKVTITAEAVQTDDAEVVEDEADEVVEKEAAPIEAEAVEEITEAEVAAEAEAEADVETTPGVEVDAETQPETPAPASRLGFFARLRRRRRASEPDPEPVAIEPEIVATEPVAIEPEIVPTVAAPEPVVEITEAIEVEPAPEVVEPALDGEIIATAATAAFDPEHAEAVLVGVLDDLGSAHHRPFSRG